MSPNGGWTEPINSPATDSCAGFTDWVLQFLICSHTLWGSPDDFKVWYNSGTVVILVVQEGFTVKVSSDASRSWIFTLKILSYLQFELAPNEYPLIEPVGADWKASSPAVYCLWNRHGENITTIARCVALRWKSWAFGGISLKNMSWNYPYFCGFPSF